nr:unnamed protein product [Callosobruchus chinensis]
MHGAAVEPYTNVHCLIYLLVFLTAIPVPQRLRTVNSRKCAPGLR